MTAKRRKSNHHFGMGSPSAGPRWLAEARHESAFQHREIAAAVTSVRHQIYTRGEAKVPGAARPGDYKTACSLQCRNRRRNDLCLVSKLFHEQLPLEKGVEVLCFLPSTHYPLYDFDLRAPHARTLLPAALASVSFGDVLVRVRVRI